MRFILFISMCLIGLSCTKEKEGGPSKSFGGNGEDYAQDYTRLRIIDVIVNPIPSQSISIMSFTLHHSIDLSNYRIYQSSKQASFFPNGTLVNDTLVFTNQSTGFSGFEIDTIADTLTLIHINRNQVINTWAH